jgi:hypothetical protein
MNTSRGLTAVALIHLAVVLASPAIGALLFLCLTLGLGSSAHFGGILAFGFGVLFSYLFYGAKTVLLVLLSSPIFWALARLKHRVPAFALAAAVGAGLGWLFGQFLMTGEDEAYVASASLASAITGAFGAPALEFAWRRARPMQSRPMQAGETASKRATSEATS